MILLPILARELRGRARRGTTCWSRGTVAAFASLLGLQTTLVYARAYGASPVGANTFPALDDLPPHR